jgi:hypothetical protein
LQSLAGGQTKIALCSAAIISLGKYIPMINSGAACPSPIDAPLWASRLRMPNDDC